MIELSEDEVALLRLVAADRVGFSQGRFFLTSVPGKPDASMALQALRARGLVVLQRTPAGQRIRPTRMCVTTVKGDNLLRELSDANT